MVYLFFVWGSHVCKLVCHSIVFELSCFVLGGEFEYEQHIAINCFWNICVALKRDDGRSKIHPDWMATEEATVGEAVL